MLVCRGCCCGTQDDVDHERHLAAITAATEMASGRLKVTNCIGPCDRKNVVVVRTRHDLGRWTSRYFGAVTAEEVDAMCQWFASGDFGGAEPAPLTCVRFDWPVPRPRPRPTGSAPDGEDLIAIEAVGFHEGAPLQRPAAG